MMAFEEFRLLGRELGHAHDYQVCARTQIFNPIPGSTYNYANCDAGALR